MWRPTWILLFCNISEMGRIIFWGLNFEDNGCLYFKLHKNVSVDKNNVNLPKMLKLVVSGKK